MEDKEILLNRNRASSYCNTTRDNTKIKNIDKN